MASQSNRPRRSYRVSNQQSVQDQPRAKWTLYLTKALADLMVEQVYRGNRQNTSFGKKAWEYICNEFQKKTGLNWDKEQLKNRYGVMRKQYAMVKSLLDLNDFSWDENLSMVKGKDEVWDEYIKAHPDAEPIRSNGCPYYKQLCKIFGVSSDYENYNQLNYTLRVDEVGSTLGSPNNANTPIDLRAPSVFMQDESSSSTEDDDNPTTKRVKSQTVNPHVSVCHKRNRKEIEEFMARAILDIATASKLRTATVTQSMERFSITTCIGALDQLKDVDDHIYYAALDLFDKPNARETFMSLKIEKRLGWLKRKCNALLLSSML